MGKRKRCRKDVRRALKGLRRQQKALREELAVAADEALSIGRAGTKLAWLQSRCVACGKCADMLG